MKAVPSRIAVQIAGDVEERQVAGFVPRTTARAVGENQQRGAADGQEPERQRALRRQGGRRDQHRREEQDREGVLQPAGEVEQGRELQDVEGEQEGRRDRR